MRFPCPGCRHELERQKTELGVLWRCSGCGGRAVSLGLLRQSVNQEFVNRLWRGARESKAPGHSARACPSCRGKMRAVLCGQGGESVEDLILDVCPTCQFVWLDAEEPARLPVAPPQTEPAPEAVPELSPEARAALAGMKVALLSQRARQDEGWDPTDSVPEEMTRCLGRLIRGLFRP